MTPEFREQQRKIKALHEAAFNEWRETTWNRLTASEKKDALEKVDSGETPPYNWLFISTARDLDFDDWFTNHYMQITDPKEKKKAREEALLSGWEILL